MYSFYFSENSVLKLKYAELFAGQNAWHIKSDSAYAGYLESIKAWSNIFSEHSHLLLFNSSAKSVYRSSSL